MGVVKGGPQLLERKKKKNRNPLGLSYTRKNTDFKWMELGYVWNIMKWSRFEISFEMKHRSEHYKEVPVVTEET